MEKHMNITWYDPLASLNCFDLILTKTIQTLNVDVGQNRYCLPVQTDMTDCVINMTTLTCSQGRGRGARCVWRGCAFL